MQIGIVSDGQIGHFVNYDRSLRRVDLTMTGRRDVAKFEGKVKQFYIVLRMYSPHRKFMNRLNPHLKISI